MNKRTSTKADTSNYSRLQNYFIGGVSPNKTPNLVIDLHKEHTSQVKK